MQANNPPAVQFGPGGEQWWQIPIGAAIYASDNVPVGALDASPGLVLVMVTRMYPRPQMFVVEHGPNRDQRRVYVQPSRKVPISAWDYTSPSQMRPAYDLGRTDGEQFLARLPDLLSAAAHL